MQIFESLSQERRATQPSHALRRFAQLLGCCLLATAAPANAQVGFEIVLDDFNSCTGDAGGARFALSGSFGQVDAVSMSGPRFQMTGSFFNPVTQEPCIGDLDGDRDNDLQDLAFLLANFARTGAGYAGGDIDADGDTDLQDLAFLLSNFGVICPR